MKVRNFLKDGTEVGTVAGIVINADEYPTIKEVIRRIERNKDNVKQVRSQGMVRA